MTADGRDADRRNLRVAVRLTGPAGAADGRTVDVGPSAGFIACAPIFEVGDVVWVDVMLSAQQASGVRIEGEVVRSVPRREADEAAPGVAVRWITAFGRDSELSLLHFLQHVLGVIDPRVTEDQGVAYPYRFAFPEPTDRQKARVKADTGRFRAIRKALGRPSSRITSAQHRAMTREPPLRKIRAPETARREAPITSGGRKHAAVAQAPPLIRSRPMAKAGGDRASAEPAPAASRPAPAPGTSLTDSVDEPAALHRGRRSGRRVPAGRLSPVKTPVGSPYPGDDAGETRPGPPAAAVGNGGLQPTPEPESPPPETSPLIGTPQTYDDLEPLSDGARDDERRVRPRIRLAVPVTYFVSSEPYVGHARDVSRSGIYVESDEELPPVDNRVTIRLPVLHAGRYHVVMLTTRVVRHKGAKEKPGSRRGFAAQFLVVDELGVPGIFSHFLSEHLGQDD